MNILMISTDAKLMEQESSVRARFREYAKYAEQIHVVVLNAKGKSEDGNIFIYGAKSFLKPLSLMKGFKVGAKILEKSKIDVITAQDPFENGMIAESLAKKFKKPLHIQVHTDLASPYFVKSHKLNKARIKIAKKVLPRATHIRVVSKRVEEGVKQFAPEAKSISILPIIGEQAESGTEIQKAEQPFPFTILLMGRLEPEKHFSVALRVLAGLKDRYPAVGLLIVGDGSLRDKLKGQARELGVADRVEFAGWLDNPAEAYGRAHMILVTSAYEGYGRIFIEATENNVPIISTRVGIVDDVLKNGTSVLSCRVDDIACLGGQIVSLLNDNHMRKELVINAKEAVSAHLAQYPNYPKLFIEDIKKAI